MSKPSDDDLERLRQATKLNAEKISESACFVCLFSEKMIEEVIPIIQMGLAVYLNKPIVLLAPTGTSIPGNLWRLAVATEFFIPGNLKSVEDATSKLMIALAGKGIIG
jgi:hypothetical protein